MATNNKPLVSSESLALIRTKMAADRTFLAYVSTSVGFAASGAGLLKFWEWQFAYVVGWALIFLSIVLVIVGVREYLKALRIYRLVKGADIDAVERDIE